MNIEKTLSLWKIITIDYWALLGFLFPLIWWAIVAYLLVFWAMPGSNSGVVFTRSEGVFIFVLAALAFTFLGAVTLLVRFFTIRSFFDDGLQAPGRVEKCKFFRGKGTLVFSYTYMGEIYRARQTVHQAKVSRIVQPGQAVTVIVDRGKPKRAIIRDLYV